MRKKVLVLLMACLMMFGMGATAFAAPKEAYPYYVTVNLTDNIVTVYEKDAAGKYTVPVRAFLCSVGKSTPEGTFRTQVKYDWRYLFGDVWGQYATRITGHYLFHSVPYFEKDKSTLEYEEYNKLGKTASMGCIRLTVEAAKWIYDNCPVGTTVKMYHGNVKEPLKPETVQKLNVNDTAKRGWDPTDPDKNNPWRKGEIRQMYPSWNANALEVYYANWTYYVTAKDGEKILSQLDAKVDLPESGMKDGRMEVIKDGNTYSLNCREHKGMVYYKIRDLAVMAGLEMSWNGETREIGMSNGENTISISETPQVVEAVSIPAKIAAFFLR